MAAIYYEGADTTKRPTSLPQADWLKPVLLNCNNVSGWITPGYVLFSDTITKVTAAG